MGTINFPRHDIDPGLPSGVLGRRHDEQPRAAAKAKRAIDAYLECAPDDPAGRLAALQQLYDAYLELALDSAAALAIRDDIETRISSWR